MSDWIDICGLDDVPPLGSRILETGDITIAIFRTSTNEIFAIEDKCPHKGGPLSQGIVHGQRVTCPLHNRVFDLREGKALAPDRGCLKRFKAYVADGRIRLELTPLALPEEDSLVVT